MRVPRTTLKSIIDAHRLKLVSKTIVRKGGERLARTPAQSVKKLP